MLKTKLEKFVAKRVLIYFMILAILDIVLMENKWYVLLGLFLGGMFSVLKFSSYSFVFSSMIASEIKGSGKSSPVRKSFIIFFINQLVLLPILYLALKYNQWFFIGVVAGILLVPLVILINCVTEPLKLTHNNFE